MIQPTTERRRGSFLLAAATIWLVAITLCSSRVFAEASHDDDHSDEHHQSAPSGDHHDEGCGCECFSSFAPQSDASTLIKAPALAPLGLLFVFIRVDEIPFESEATPSLSQSTGPPERISFAELVLQRCRHSHAPPILT